MTEKVTLICEFCGKAYKVYPSEATPRRKYCSVACRGANRSRMFVGEKSTNWKGGKSLAKICEKCGKTFYVYPGNTESRYCSKSCHSSAKMSGEKCNFWKGGTKTKICPYCGKLFEVHQADKSRKYCSKKCLDEVRMKRVSLVCTNCGKEYEDKFSRANRYSHSFCSMKCRNQFTVGENNNLWRGGVSFWPYPQNFNEPFKRIIRERDNYTCAICGKRGKDVHHIDYDKNNLAPENLITLCRRCHAKTNSNREYWLKFFIS